MTLTPKQVKSIRQRLGWTQARLASELNVTIQAIKNWENGRRTCSGPAEAMLRLLDDRGEN